MDQECVDVLYQFRFAYVTREVDNAIADMEETMPIVAATFSDDLASIAGLRCVGRSDRASRSTMSAAIAGSASVSGSVSASPVGLGLPVGQAGWTVSDSGPTISTSRLHAC